MAGQKILLIQCEDSFFINQLKELNYSIIEVQNVKRVEEKIIETSPNLIICPLKLNGYSGFEVYSMTKEWVIHHKIPYLLIADKFRNNDIYIAEEIGIDGYLFPPFDKNVIHNIITAKLTKSRYNISVGKHRFRNICEILPYAVFVITGRIITEANKAFFELVDNIKPDSSQLLINDIFNLSNKNDDIKYMRMMNGLTEQGIFLNISLVNHPLHTFNLYLSGINFVNSPLHIFGMAIPCTPPKKSEQNTFIDRESDYIDKNYRENIFTQREEQILKLSAIGTPVKLIADELGISARTVEKHRSNIISKTNSGNIIEALHFAKNNYLLEIFD